MASGFGVINEGLHYRASRDWGERIGFSSEALPDINIRGIEFCGDFARQYESNHLPKPTTNASTQAQGLGRVVLINACSRFATNIEITPLRSNRLVFISVSSDGDSRPTEGASRATAQSIFLPIELPGNTRKAKLWPDHLNDHCPRRTKSCLTAAPSSATSFIDA